MELGGITFDWEGPKAETNLRKHDIHFNVAASIFFDPLSVTVPDPDHSIGEARFLITGRSRFGTMLVVSHTERGGTIHIISARRATPKEVREYEQG